MRSSPREWTKEELAVLRDKYYELGGEGLSKILNRTAATIRSKANKMGLKHKYRSGWHKIKATKGFWHGYW